MQQQGRPLSPSHRQVSIPRASPPKLSLWSKAAWEKVASWLQQRHSHLPTTGVYYVSSTNLNCSLPTATIIGFFLGPLLLDRMFQEDRMVGCHKGNFRMLLLQVLQPRH